MKIFSRLIILKAALIVCGLVIFLSAFVHPAGNLRTVGGRAQPLLQDSLASPAVLAILGRSCQNCHSENTEWPIYSYIAPVSWIIENDVNTARRHMNLTSWPAYTSAEKIEILTKLAPLVRNRIMPPQRYLALHPRANLSAADISQLAKWAHEERKVVERPPGPESRP